MLRWDAKVGHFRPHRCPHSEATNDIRSRKWPHCEATCGLTSGLSVASLERSGAHSHRVCRIYLGLVSSVTVALYSVYLKDGIKLTNENIHTLHLLGEFDEKGPPEDPNTKEFLHYKKLCQKYIGQMMWLTTRTRPDIAAILGALASAMTLRPKQVFTHLTHLWRYLVTSKDLAMSTIKLASNETPTLSLQSYCDASLSCGGG